MRAYSYDVLQDKDLFAFRINTCVESVLCNEMLRQNDEYEDFMKLFLKLSASRKSPTEGL